MHAALHRRSHDVSGLANYKAARVALGRRARESRNFFVRDSHGSGEIVCERSEARTENYGDARPQLCLRENEFRGAIGTRKIAQAIAALADHARTHRSMIPTIEADMRFAIVPAIIARMPRRARSPLRFGASAPIPPI